VAIKTELRFTKLTSGNIKKLHLVDFSEEMMRYITGSSLSYDQAVDRYSVDIDHAYFGSYFVENPVEDQMVGFAVIKDKGKEMEIGYLVMEPYRGKGIATQINKELIGICRKNLEGRTIYGQTDIRNQASIRVLEKSGMRKIDTSGDRRKTIHKFGMDL
jgi:ribosomal-protein-alanine N-acetyltransferase